VVVSTKHNIEGLTMKAQGQWLFEAPFVLEGERYINLFSNLEGYSNPELEWEAPTAKTLEPLTKDEQAAFNQLTSNAKLQFTSIRSTVATYQNVARREADRGSRVLLKRGLYQVQPKLLPEILNLMNLGHLLKGWTLEKNKPLLVGNVLYNLAFPETINQGGTDRLGGTPDPTCFSASTQILLSRRFPATYVRLTSQLATTGRCTFPGGDKSTPPKFLSTSLYKSLDSVLLQTAFDHYFAKTAIVGDKYKVGDELKVHRQVFGSKYPPRNATGWTRDAMTAAFRKAFITKGGNTRMPEIINICVGGYNPNCTGNHTVVLSRIKNGRVFFYNPWANEEERNTMFGTAKLTISGNGERPAESSMTQANFESLLSGVFHN
jgi:hypothetical protein